MKPGFIEFTGMLFVSEDQKSCYFWAGEYPIALNPQAQHWNESGTVSEEEIRTLNYVTGSTNKVFQLNEQRFYVKRRITIDLKM